MSKMLTDKKLIRRDEREKKILETVKLKFAHFQSLIKSEFNQYDTNIQASKILSKSSLFAGFVKLLGDKVVDNIFCSYPSNALIGKIIRDTYKKFADCGEDENIFQDQDVIYGIFPLTMI